MANAQWAIAIRIDELIMIKGPYCTRSSTSTEPAPLLLLLPHFPRLLGFDLLQFFRPQGLVLLPPRRDAALCAPVELRSDILRALQRRLRTLQQLAVGLCVACVAAPPQRRLQLAVRLGALRLDPSQLVLRKRHRFVIDAARACVLDGAPQPAHAHTRLALLQLGADPLEQRRREPLLCAKPRRLLPRRLLVARVEPLLVPLPQCAHARLVGRHVPLRHTHRDRRQLARVSAGGDARSARPWGCPAQRRRGAVQARGHTMR
eukprot:6449440-Prymnesium_polylepis.2